MEGLIAMPWIMSEPPKNNKHTMKAKRLDAKAAKASRRGNAERADRLERKADRKAAKGGWF